MRREGSSPSSGGVRFPSPRPRQLKLADGGSRHGASAAGAAHGAGGRRRVVVVLPSKDPLLGFVGAVSGLGTGPVGDLGFGLGHPVQIDVVVGERTFGRLHLGLLSEEELQVNGHLTR